MPMPIACWMSATVLLVSVAGALAQASSRWWPFAAWAGAQALALAVTRGGAWSSLFLALLLVVPCSLSLAALLLLRRRRVQTRILVAFFAGLFSGMGGPAILQAVELARLGAL